MSFEKIKDIIHEDRLDNRPPEDIPTAEEFSPPVFAPRAFVLMRVMLTVVNLAALVFGRSFLQSWYGVHGTTPIWIPLLFLTVPLGSLIFIYYCMGRIGSERIIKLICLVCCLLQTLNIFFPVSSSRVSLGKGGYSYDRSYITNVGNEIGIKFPTCESSATVDGALANSDKGDAVTSLKAFFSGEKIYFWSDVIFSAEQSAEFEEFVKTNPLWLDEIPKKLKRLACISMLSDGYDKILFFDCDARAYNALPESGRHDVYQIMYNLQNHEMRIIKYTKNF